MNMVTNRHQQGFTLLEVMVALAIFAVAAIAVTRAAMSYTQSVDQLRERTWAHWVLMNQVTQLRLTESWPEGSGDDNVEAFGQRWKIHFQTYPTPSERVRRVELNVAKMNAQDQAGASIQRMVFFLGQPQGRE